MSIEKDYLAVNQKLWNDKVAHHIQSDFYNNTEFLNGNSSLQDIELALLGDISEKSILHLQCHFGQDTISLSRMGAKATGIDLSDKAIKAAQEFAKQTKSNAKFICCDVYDTPNHISQKFDMVFTTYGTIGWLPDINKWANVVSHFLKPGGQLVFVDFHPVIWMFDDDFTKISYRYFNSVPIIESTSGTYANKNAEIKNDSVSWNHGLSEVLRALIKSGLNITDLNEYDYSPYPCFNHVEEISSGKWQIRQFTDKVPMVYSIVATKK